LVGIHPFPNGNGRHSRSAADYLLQSLGEERFSWGTALMVTTEQLRERYIGALRRADAGDITELLTFARS
jgi:fido (protein-threonine AMPylation protein)